MNKAHSYYERARERFAACGDERSARRASGNLALVHLRKEECAGRGAPGELRVGLEMHLVQRVERAFFLPRDALCVAVSLLSGIVRVGFCGVRGPALLHGAYSHSTHLLDRVLCPPWSSAELTSNRNPQRPCCGPFLSFAQCV